MKSQGYKQLLKKFVSFKTVSTDPQFRTDINGCVGWLVDLFRDHGFMVETWSPFAGSSASTEVSADKSEGQERPNPVVFASFGVGADETILVYGHYDVQPASVEDGWKGDPFSLREDAGRYFGRGVLDNKGQILIHIFAVLQLIREKKLSCNVKFVIEGNEESEEGVLRSKIQDSRFKRKLAADCILISDGEIESGRPALEVSLRGGFNCTLRLKTAENDLHSGQHGGVAPNAAGKLAKILAVLEFPQLREGMDMVTQEQRASLSDFQVQTGLFPTIQVTGLKSGYTEEGYKNIIPAVAEARLNFRLVCSQKPEQVFASFKRYVQGLVSPGVQVSLIPHGFHNPVKLDTNFAKVGAVKKILAEVYGQEVVHKPVGGAVPVVTDFQKHIQKQILLVPLGNNDGNMHGAEENFRIDLIEKGLEFSQKLFSL